MQTKSRDATATSDRDRRLLSIADLPGHQMPDTPVQCGAAETSKIGRPLRFASAIPDSSVPYQAIRGVIFESSASAEVVMRPERSKVIALFIV